MNQSNKHKAIAIARVSSKEQAEGYSIDAQKKPIVEYCKRKEIEIVQTFEFWESAGIKKDRKHFQAAIKYLLENDLRIICVEKTDRLYRNFRDYVTIENLVEQQGIAIHLVKEGEVFDKSSNSHAKVVHGFKVLMAKAYLDNLSEEVKKGLAQKAEKGHLPTVAPFGYKNNPETRLIEIDKTTAPIIRRIFNMYDSGRYSVKEIAMCLNDYGYKTRFGGPFHHSTVHRILKNPVHYGDFNFRGTVMKGKHEPIVSYDMWKRCSDRLNSRYQNPLQNKRSFPLAGLLYNEFNRRFTGDVTKGFVYYGSSIPGQRKKIYMRQDRIWAEIDRQIESIRWSEIFAAEIRVIAQEILKEGKDFYAKNLTKIRQRIDDLTRQKQRLLELYMAEDIGRPEFLAQRKTVETELKKQKDWIKRHSKGDKDFDTKLTALVDAFLHVPTAYAEASPVRKAKLLSKLVERVTITTRKTVILDYKSHLAQFISPEMAEVNKIDAPEMIRAHPVLRAIRDKLRTFLFAA